MTCRKKKPVGGVSLFGGADIFGGLNKSPGTGGSSILEASMKNKNEVCTMCVWGEGKERGGGGEGVIHIHVCGGLGGGGQLAGGCGRDESTYC